MNKASGISAVGFRHVSRYLPASQPLTFRHLSRGASGISAVTFRHLSRGLTAEMPSKDRYKARVLKGWKVFRCVFAALMRSTDKQLVAFLRNAHWLPPVTVVEDKIKNSRSVRA